VFILKCRRKVFAQIRHHLATQKESRIEQRHLQLDHVHMLISIPPNYAVSQVVGFIKGKARSTLWRKGKELVWRVFHRYRRDETENRECIKNQEAEDNRLEQLTL
jgi:putative transposase